MKWSFLFLGGFGAILAGLVGWIWFRQAPRRDTNLVRAVEQANALIKRAGGAELVCTQADGIFDRFGLTNLVFLKEPDLKDYPAIEALGEVDGIVPGPPACIKVRVGNHQNGFILEIAETNTGIAYPISFNQAEIVKSRIFVHR